MVNLPVINRMDVVGYRLFPGEQSGDGIVWRFRPGLSLIVGINGLGKTTLLTMILRAFTGPYDLTGDGMPQSLGVGLPENPVWLAQGRRFFADRVADGAASASVTLVTTIGEKSIQICRLLKDMSLAEFYVDDQPFDLPSSRTEREKLSQSHLADMMGLGSFVDVLLVLHHMILFLEDRPGALWDRNAQRQLLRALCLDAQDANQLVKIERELQTADSQARNIHARINATERDLARVRRKEYGAEAVVAQLEEERKLLEADVDNDNRLQAELVRLDEERRRVRLAYERVKLEYDDAAGASERLKYTALSTYFPNMEETSRLIISRIMTEGRCLACNSDAEAKRIDLERMIEQGRCPICGADPEIHDGVIAHHTFEQARIDQARERLQRVRYEKDTTSRALRDLTSRYDEALNELSRVRVSIRERERTDQRLRSKLPPTVTSAEYESTLKALTSQLRRWDIERASKLRELRSLLDRRRSTLLEKSNELKDMFAKLTRDLLVEEVRLANVSVEPKYLQASGQQHERVQVSAYAAEMMAADRVGFVRRDYPTEVSESQRELVDLAFRLALVKVFGGVGTFIMETPEASLDGLAMERVGKALGEFAAERGNRLVVTSNLTNVGIVTALFDISTMLTPIENPWDHVLDLTRIAVPNQALRQDGVRYRELLDKVIAGSTE